MPELVADGPTIPVQLMNELDNGSVVFFCGAGISAVPGSELPQFRKLVQHLYAANHMEPDGVEREALDLDEADPGRRQAKFDKALGLLERPGRLGAQALRQSVIDRLSKAPTGPLNVHGAVIALSRCERGVRLITTNFDNRFAEAGLEEKLIDAAPKLPVPKPHSWSSLVHLHGRIASGEDGSNLVLTAADFGRAYLTEQWAARFVTELFREFTIVFVGYSVGDPVMSYMVDALAAERAKGARFATAYAFAHHDGTLDGKQKARDGWLAKNVEPILYADRESHALLGETLIEWARIRNDPFRARSQIAITEMTKMPGGPEDPSVERVVWALQDPVAAKALADEPVIEDEAEFPKVEKWLEMFAERGLLRSAAADASAIVGDQDPAFVRLVDSGLQVVSPQTVDMTRANLARWLAGHVHVPQFLAWFLRAGGHMHPVLRQEIQRRLANQELNIPSSLRLLWTVLVDQEPRDPWRLLWILEHYRAAGSELEQLCVEDEAIKSLAPRLEVRPGPASRLAFRQYFDGRARPIRPIEACGHLKLVSGDEDVWHQVKGLFENPGVLARNAERLSDYLEQALARGEQDDGVYEESYLYRPSISAHDQNQEHDRWTHLIDLVRDSYFALGSVDRGRAGNLLSLWVQSRRSLFKRLALHALAENPKADIQLARKLLIAGRKPGVWEFDLRREVLRFLRMAGLRLPRSLRAEIVRAIHAGPKSGRGKTRPDYTRIIRHEKVLRLHKLVESGARLDKRSRELAGEGTEGGRGERDEFAGWHSEGRWVSDEEFAPKALLEGSVADVVAVIEDEKIGRDAFRGLVALQPVKAASALRRVAMGRKWPATIWQEFLWALDGACERPGLKRRMRGYVARLLVGAPDELFAEVGSAAAGFVKDLAEEYGIDRERELTALWRKVWGGVSMSGSEGIGLDDPLTEALNDAGGKLAEVALIRLWKYEPVTSAGLPAAVRPYFDVVGDDAAGQLGRVMLATRLHQLFAIDPDWAREHLIARLDPAGSEEAGSLWSAYCWSPSVGPDLLQAFKEPFLGMLRADRDMGRRKGKLAALFMTICLEAPNELTAEEIGHIVGAMSEDALMTVVTSLGNRLRGSENDRARIWGQKITPWLQKYWPRAADRNTAKTSLAILQMLVECGDGFPEAVAWSLPYLRPVEDHGLHRLGRNPQTGRHPKAMLSVLDRVCVENILPTHQRHTLREILDDLGRAKPALRGDAGFHRLYRLATR